MRSSVWTAVLGLAAGLGVYAAELPTAEACGCLSPPVPEFDDSEFAVNQQAEQIIFEVEPDGVHVTAHVLIRYAGRPEQFAWLVPAPTVPDFSLGSDATFGLLDGLTAPQVTVAQPSLCPDPLFTCEYHPDPSCPLPADEFNNASNNFDGAPGNNDFNEADAGTGGGDANPVEVLKREQVGDYDTVVFTAAEADLAIDWLNDNGFIVNDTMTPYMQPYLDAGMVFVASKLIAGATTEQIKPLKMRYESTKPMIPLQLTAVAAEPHLTVTSYIVHNGSYFSPEDRPVVAIDPRDISTDNDGRVNYPMVLARSVDDAGGDGFVIEYAGSVPEPQFDGCCGAGDDFCLIGGDGLCQCPLDDFDADDCGEQTDLMDGYAMLTELSENYSHLTRLTTRLSPEEMTFDPVFDADPDIETFGRLQLQGERRQMWGCEDDVIDESLYNSIEQLVDCAATYCGRGICGATPAGQAGCICESGFTARQFTDLDGAPSVTCVPEVGTVDLAAGGLDLPTACKPSTCGSGACLDVGGFATCNCNGNLATPNENDNVPSCASAADALFAGDSGARDYTTPMVDVRACAPAPPSCGEFGWLVDNPNIRIDGVQCETSLPTASALEVPRKPTCDDIYPGYSERYGDDPSVDADFDGNPDAVQDKDVGGGCAGCTTTAGGGAGTLLLSLLGLLVVRRRRR